MNNMKQIGLGMMQYLQDYDEAYPRAWGGLDPGSAANPADIETNTGLPGGVYTVSPNAGGAPGHYRTWMDFIYPYVKSVQVFRCPSALASSNLSGYASYGYSIALSGYGSYSYYFSGNAGAPTNTPIKMAAVRRPAQIVAMIEYQNGYNYTASMANINTYAKLPPTNAAYNYVTPHLDGGVAVFADGHAKWRSRAQMLQSLTGKTSLGVANPTVSPCTPITNIACADDWNPYID